MGNCYSTILEIKIFFPCFFFLGTHIIMSIYSSDSDIDHHDHHRHLDHRHGHPVKLFGHGRTLHSTFGGGKGKRPWSFSLHVHTFWGIRICSQKKKNGKSLTRPVKLLITSFISIVNENMKVMMPWCLLRNFASYTFLFTRLKSKTVTFHFLLGWFCSCWHIVMEEQEIISCNLNWVNNYMVSFWSSRVPFCYSSMLYPSFINGLYIRLVSNSMANQLVIVFFINIKSF